MRSIFTPLCLYVAASLASAVDLSVHVYDKNGKPIADAVVIARNATTDMQSSVDLLKPGGSAEIVQINKEFVPYVTAIEAGTRVNFPNNDSVKHHVYSFSTPKKFDLPLYSGTAAPPVRFDKPGIVVIGCNIHDWMIGYIFIADTPYFAKTDASGKAILKNLPIGNLTVKIWHPDALDSEEKTARQVEAGAGENSELTWHLAIKPRINPRHSSLQDMNGY